MAEERITVSRDALRADLAEMELRLRLYFDERLNHKADLAAMNDYALRLDRLDRGEFSDVHIRALDDFFEKRLSARAEVGWTRRERWFAMLGVAVTFSMFLLSVYLAAHGGAA